MCAVNQVIRHSSVGGSRHRHKAVRPALRNQNQISSQMKTPSQLLNNNHKPQPNCSVSFKSPIKTPGQKAVTYVAHGVVMNITFPVIEDAVSPIISPDALLHNGVSFHLFQSGKHIFSNMVKKQYFATSGISTIHQGWSLKLLSKVRFWNGRVPMTLPSTHS